MYIFFSYFQLPNLDTFSKTDPMVVLYIQDSSHPQWEEIGRTEIIFDNLNPRFVTAIQLDYHFEENQHLRFDVYDIDNAKKSHNLSKQQYIGRFSTTLSAIIVSKGQMVRKPLVNPRKKKAKLGSIVVSAIELQESNYTINGQFSASGLPRLDFLGKSDPFLVLERIMESGSSIPVFKTEVVKRSLNPTWKKFSVSMSTLSNGDWDSPLRLVVYDWNRSGKHDYMGEAKVTVRQLHERGTVAGKGRQIPLFNLRKKKKSKKKKPVGHVNILYFTVVKEFSFLDYIRGGLEINLFIAVDFTASNGAPSNPNSLHRNIPGQENPYQRALRSSISVLQHYDFDQLFPAFGFGAKMPNGMVSHCFPLNGNFQNPNCAGIDGVMKAYSEALNNITFYGPTVFAPTIRVALQAAQSQAESGDGYTILLLLTDGVLNDEQNTIDAIVEASDFPLSIVIVGVGNADFSAMEVLDADEEPLVHSVTGRVGRDIVQFIPFNNFKNKPDMFISKALLEEIPFQCVEYFKSKNIKPRPPREASFQQSFAVNKQNNQSSSSLNGLGTAVSSTYQSSTVATAASNARSSVAPGY